MRFQILVDYKAAYSAKSEIPYEMFELDSNNIYDVFDEAEEYIDDNVYMVYLFEKDGRKTKGANGETIVPYRSIFANRGYGWHRTTEKHGEREIRINVNYYTNWKCYDFI